MKHYHVYLAQPDYPLRALMTRASDVFRTRPAAKAWAQHWPAAYRLVRQCEGGRGCPGDAIPEHGQREPLPEFRRRKPRARRPARLVRLRNALDGLDAAALARIEALIEEVTA